LVSDNATVTLTNCTVSGNSASVNGGGVFIDGGAATLINCTVSGNSTSASGGGLYITLGQTSTLTNTIVAGNTAGDILGTITSNSANNVVGNGSGMTGISNGSQGNQVGTDHALINPLLAPLGSYGGPTQTMALLPGSPAIGGGGSGFGVPTNDQRGSQRTSHVDIGAFQSQGFVIKTVTGSTPQSIGVSKPFKNPLAIEVTANNPAEPVNGGVVSFVVNPAGGASAALSSATGTISGGEAAVNATANATPGPYTVTASALGAGSTIFDLSNIEVPRLKGTSPPIVVKLTDGLTGLRDAIAYANSHPGPDTIILDPPAMGAKPQTIRLTGGPLVLTDPATTTIVGPGATRLTLKGDGKSRLFDIEGGSLALSGVTITGGNAGKGSGGGIRNHGGKLWLNDVVLRGNRARKGGGLFNDGTTTLTDVVMRGNTARRGPGMFSTRRATLAWLKSPAAGAATLGFPSNHRRPQHESHHSEV
jgi:parallel beta-helix repeat protein